MKYLAATLLAFSLASAGCGSGADLAPLSGEVRYKGKPLEFGSIMLQPVEGGQPSTSTIAADGSFVMQVRDVGEGAAIGVNRIRITCYPAQKPGSAANANQELALGRSLIPTRYTSFGSSDLSVDVQPGENEPLIIELDDK